MKTSLAIRNLDGVQIEVLPDALAHRETALTAAREITAVEDSFSQECAVTLMRDLQTIVKSVEKTRKDIKAPVLDIGRKIDNTAATYTAPIEVEINRVNALVTQYQIAERVKAAELERRRLAELARIERERAEAERKEAERLRAILAAQEAERKAREDQESAFSKKEATEAARKLAESQAEQSRQVEAAKREREKLAQLEKERLAQQPVKVVAKPSGLSVRTVWKFEVTSVVQLFESHPDLVNLEARTRDINNAIGAGMRTCPGLRIWSEVESQVR